MVFNLLVDLTNLSLYILNFALQFLIQVGVARHATYKLTILVSLLPSSLLDHDGFLLEAAFRTVAV